MISITRNYGTIIEDPHARVEAAKNDLRDLKIIKEEN